MRPVSPCSLRGCQNVAFPKHTGPGGIAPARLSGTTCLAPSEAEARCRGGARSGRRRHALALTGVSRSPPGGCREASPRPASEPHRVAQRAHLSVVWGQTSSGFEGREARLTADSGTHFIGCVTRFSRGNPWSPGQADPSVDTVVHITCRWSRAGTEQRGLLSHSS